jgi:hypothetical protein
MPVKMHERCAVRTIGETFIKPVSALSDIGGVVFTTTKHVIFQKVQYITTKKMVDVPVDELYEVREPVGTAIDWHWPVS